MLKPPWATGTQARLDDHSAGAHKRNINVEMLTDMKQYVITPDTTYKALLGAVSVALGIIARRALFAAQKTVKTAKIWLNNKHAFCRDNDNPAGIVLTGWQYIGFNALAGLVLIIIAMIGD